MYWFWYILIGLAAGYCAALLVRGRGMGFIANLAAGVIGSVLGGWLFAEIGLDIYGRIGSLVTATVGAILLLLLIGIFTKTY